MRLLVAVFLAFCLTVMAGKKSKGGGVCKDSDLATFQTCLESGQYRFFHLNFVAIAIFIMNFFIFSFLNKYETNLKQIRNTNEQTFNIHETNLKQEPI